MHFSSMKKKMLPDEKAPQMDDGETPPEKPGGTLTGNCTIMSLTNNGKINVNAYTITLADGTVLK